MLGGAQPLLVVDAAQHPLSGSRGLVTLDAVHHLAGVRQPTLDLSHPPPAILADRLVVTRHMRRFLEQRMAALKKIAESAAWRRYLPVAPHTSAAVHER